MIVSGKVAVCVFMQEKARTSVVADTGVGGVNQALPRIESRELW